MKQPKQLKQLINLDNCPIYIDEDYILANDEYYVETDDDYDYLTDDKFFPTLDDRAWKSNIEDIEGGDNFVDFCDEFFKMLNEEEYWDD